MARGFSPGGAGSISIAPAAEEYRYASGVSARCAHWIQSHIQRVSFIVSRIANAVVRELRLPDHQIRIHLALNPIRESALYKLNRLFQRNVGRGRNQEMKMVRHEDKLVHEKPALCALPGERVQEKSRQRISSENGTASPRARGDEKGPDFLGSEFHCGARG